MDNNNHRIDLTKLTKVKVLGQGTFGRVTLVKDDNGNKFVVKEVNKLMYNSLDPIINEIEINKILSEYPNCHPQVTCLYDYFIRPNHDTAVIVYIYLEGYYDIADSLLEIENKGKINFELFNKLFRNVIKAVKYLHERNIIHRDLKENNILTNNKGDIHIIDFGLSTIYPDKDEISGTKGYIDPYVWNDNNCFISDVFAIAIMFYKFLINKNTISNYFYLPNDIPYHGYENSFENQYQKIRNNIDSFNFPSKYIYYNTLLKHMLNPFGIRPSINEISTYLQNDGKTPLKIEDYKKCIDMYPKRNTHEINSEQQKDVLFNQCLIDNSFLICQKTFPKSRKASRKSRKASRKSRKVSRKASRKASRKSRKASRKVSRKESRKSRKASRKASRKVSRKASKKSRKASRKASRKVSRKLSRKASRKSRKVSRKSRKVSRKSRRSV